VFSEPDDMVKASNGRLALLAEAYLGKTGDTVMQGRNCGASRVPHRCDDTRPNHLVSICTMRVGWARWY